MPRAVPQPIREEIVQRRRAEEPLTQIAAALKLPYRTVRGIWSRYRSRGAQGLAPDYDRCSKPGPRYRAELVEAAQRMKRTHPRWGAMRICIELAHLFPQEALPKRRTVQEWLQKAGLSPGRSRSPASPKQRGRKAHEVWQLDAKDQMRLLDGSPSASFSMVDEATGAVLGVALFPPEPGQCGAGPGGAGMDRASAFGVGDARANAGG
jgi:transposase